MGVEQKRPTGHDLRQRDEAGATERKRERPLAQDEARTTEADVQEYVMANALTILEAKIRANGRVFSRHYQNVRPEQARRKAQRLGKVMWIRKVPLWEIMGDINTKNLSDIISGEKEVKGDLMMEERSLEEILFPKRGERRRKDKERRTEQ